MFHHHYDKIARCSKNDLMNIHDWLNVHFALYLHVLYFQLTLHQLNAETIAENDSIESKDIPSVGARPICHACAKKPTRVASVALNRCEPCTSFVDGGYGVYECIT